MPVRYKILIVGHHHRCLMLIWIAVDETILYNAVILDQKGNFTFIP